MFTNVTIHRHAGRDDTIFGKCRKSIRSITGRHSVVGVTRYVLHCSVFEPRWRGFSVPVQSGPQAHPVSRPRSTWSLPGVEWPEDCADHPPASSAHIGERIDRITLPLCCHGMVAGELYQSVVQELKETSLWLSIALVVLVILRTGEI
jgi:hypothetical protein